MIRSEAMVGRIFCLALLVGCGGSDPAWRLLDAHEPASLLAVWGSSSDDVWVVGGRAELTGGPTVLRYHDGAWSRMDTGQASLDLWWVFGAPEGDVFFGGSGGAILRYRGGAFERMTTPRTGTIFGLWGASADDMWAVGDGGAAGGIVWHYDGGAWSEVPLPPGVPSRVFKIHGQARDDVWIVCGDGSALHWQGSALERETTGTSAPLFSVVTTPTRVIAVGGANGEGQIAERSGGAWTLVPSLLPAVWRGAAVSGEEVYAVGELGAAAERSDQGWAINAQHLTSRNFHAAWIDPEGGVWGVGGNFDQTPLTTDGFLEYFGTAPATTVAN